MELDYSEFWNECVSQLRREKSITEELYAMWFRNINYRESKGDTIILSAPSQFIIDQLTQKGLVDTLKKKLYELTGSPIELQFSISRKEAPIGVTSLPQREEGKKAHSQLNVKYDFDSFVVGSNNEHASSAAKAIAQKPGAKFNPFLIYGGVGMGKTHLMQAIGNFIHEQDPKKRIIYISAESFLNEFINSIQKNDQKNNFKNKYRKVDLLLIDDIHDLHSKKETQEELFHTFNSLYNANKQMVFTCDRPPTELKNFNERLKSRFTSGIISDIYTPDYETRLAILKKKVKDKGYEGVNYETLKIIAENVNSNVRDLEAALTHVYGYFDLTGKNIAPEVIKEKLRIYFSLMDRDSISIDKIQKVVTNYYNITLSELKSKKRVKTISFPRQVAMYIVREKTELSTTEIGYEFGGRDHTTVMHACQKIENLLKTDSTLTSIINNLIRTIQETTL